MATVLTYGYRGMWAIASNEGICPPSWKLAFKRTTEWRQVQPQDGSFDTSADTVKALNFSGPDRSLRLFNTIIIPDYFNMI